MAQIPEHPEDGSEKCPVEKCVGCWNLSDERAFMENLLCQRFNFFVVMFSLFLASAFTAQAQIARTYILVAGAVVSLAVASTVYRAYVKHRWIVKHIYKYHKCHPTTRVDEGVKEYGGWKCFSVNWIIGVAVPLLCVIVLVLLAWRSSQGDFNLPAGKPT